MSARIRKQEKEILLHRKRSHGLSRFLKREYGVAGREFPRGGVRKRINASNWVHNAGAPLHYLLFFCLFYYIVPVIPTERSDEESLFAVFEISHICSNDKYAIIFPP